MSTDTETRARDEAEGARTTPGDPAGPPAEAPLGTGAAANDLPGRGAWRRVAPQARTFLRRRLRPLVRLGAWSLLESGQTFLGGYGVARAMDDGFLAGRTGVGLAWLAVGALAVLVGGLATRGVFRHLADLVEPLRDGLVRRVVARTLHVAVGAPARVDTTAVSRLTSQTEIARDGFAGLVLVTRSFVFTALGALVGLAALAPLLLLVVLPPLALGMALFTWTLAPTAVRQRQFLDADEAVSGRFGAAAAGLRDVTACGAEERIAREADVLIEDGRRASTALARWAAARNLALGVAGQLPVMLLLVCTPWLLDAGVTAGELLGALTFLTQSLLPALHTLINALGTAGTRLLVVLDRLTFTGDRHPSGGDRRPSGASGAPAAPPAKPVPTPNTHSPDPGPGPHVALRGVTFAYGPNARPVLQDLELDVEPGRFLAVVGPSGIGKSTLTGLVAGLLEPARGTVHVDGVPVRPPRGPEASGERVLIPQQAYVFGGSLRDNLTYLCPDGSLSHDAAVRRSAEAVGLGALVEQLGGYDGEVDPAALSQGERQLIALARAHLSPAPLVLLDEATCHLDPVAEARAERAFAERPGTVIVVAHRISSALRADRVLVLDGDRALCGTHDDLLARSPLYAELVGHWHPARP
ncbi:ABC transporter ATP-binding protein [Streptomyces sp. RKND-216]|uniref:ATP-binding cassette domain-containing protein n=1 Tax=Streptomyces sp. RKND-216 TaxID=2562581 RepID=UPI00109DC168|nr:ABC transporter ATP-binding protein [Streptomyces sp. RKND-216]THA26238.1 ABC transporter ATP-binding protein [Streptomyces sp. RKND-216]